ncbi:hypothetical protein PoB_007111700 [Plakobranchus ocellatus]|uniref:Uncharacterized protein n=1 Tax=Plakobranchus ocellatus TaxID=259542 RepID=A0AAV4DK00_9GAST|nr:hypothetical protein PoB_007111700 [Plakobranchus ocellatus]
MTASKEPHCTAWIIVFESVSQSSRLWQKNHHQALQPSLNPGVNADITGNFSREVREAVLLGKTCKGDRTKCGQMVDFLCQNHRQRDCRWFAKEVKTTSTTKETSHKKQPLGRPCDAVPPNCRALVSVLLMKDFLDFTKPAKVGDHFQVPRGDAIVIFRREQSVTVGLLITVSCMREGS